MEKYFRIIVNITFVKLVKTSDPGLSVKLESEKSALSRQSYGSLNRRESFRF